MEPARARRLDVIHQIQRLRAERSQTVLRDDHYIWNCLNQDHYDFLYTLTTRNSYSINIRDFNIFSDVQDRIAQNVDNEFNEQIEADLARRQDEEENRVLPQSSAGIADTFEELAVQNLVEEFTVADHSNVESLHETANRDEEDIIQEEVEPLFEEMAFYIRQATFNRADIERHLRQYSEDNKADAEWAQIFMGVLATDTSNPQEVHIHYAGITSRSLQQRVDEDAAITASTSRTRLINFNEIANPQWIIRQVRNIDFSGAPNINRVQRVMDIGYIEDILIKSLGPFKLNKANGGLLVDWDPTTEDIAMARQFLTGWEIARKRRLTESDQDLLPLVTEHMRYYYQFTTNNLNYQEFELQDQDREQLLARATREAVNFGYVKTVNVSDDASLRSLKEGKTFYSDEQDLHHGPTFARHMLRKIGLLTGDIATFEEETPALYRPFINLFGFSRVLMLSVAIPFTSRYLAIVQPDIIVSSSATVLGTIMKDSYMQYWIGGDSDSDITIADFYTETNAIKTIEDLDDISTHNVYSLNSMACRNVTQHTGEVYLVNYSPYAIDLCLVFVERHSGALKYHPDFQHLYCRERFLTSLLLERLESIVQDAKRRNFNGRFLNAELKRLFYREIKTRYEEAVRSTAIYDELQKVKAAIVRLQEIIMRQRGRTRVQRTAGTTFIAAERANVIVRRRPAEDVAHRTRTLERRPFSRRVVTQRISVSFNGEPHSAERREQMERIRQDYRRVRDNGFIIGTGFPMPRTVPSIDSEEYATWFMSAQANIDIIRSAAATGTNTYQNLTDEQKDEWLRVRGFGRFGIPPSEQLLRFPQAKNVLALIVDLCDTMKFRGWNGHFPYTRLHCKSCHEFCAADRNTEHRCPNDDHKLVPRESDTFVQFRLFYPHDLIDQLLYDENTEQAAKELQQRNINTMTCQDVINTLNLEGLRAYPNQMAQLEQRLLFNNTTEGIHIQAMALDIWLKQACQISTFNPPNSSQDSAASDAWLFDASKTKSPIKDYFQIRRANRHPIRLCEQYCPLGCGYYGIRLPCAENHFGTNHFYKHQQHKCSKATSTNRQCAFGPSAGRIFELPYPAARYALYLWATNPGEYLNPFTWNATTEAPDDPPGRGRRGRPRAR